MATDSPFDITGTDDNSADANDWSATQARIAELEAAGAAERDRLRALWQTGGDTTLNY
jgi:hypothetical protein